MAEKNSTYSTTEGKEVKPSVKFMKDQLKKKDQNGDHVAT